MENQRFKILSWVGGKYKLTANGMRNFFGGGRNDLNLTMVIIA